MIFLSMIPFPLSYTIGVSSCWSGYRGGVDEKQGGAVHFRWRHEHAQHHRVSTDIFTYLFIYLFLSWHFFLLLFCFSIYSLYPRPFLISTFLFSFLFFSISHPIPSSLLTHSLPLSFLSPFPSSLHLHSSLFSCVFLFLELWKRDDY